MKKIVFTLTALLFLCTSSPVAAQTAAQDAPTLTTVSGGLRLGLNLAKFRGDNSGFETRFGGLIGAFLLVDPTGPLPFNLNFCSRKRVPTSKTPMPSASTTSRT